MYCNLLNLKNSFKLINVKLAATRVVLFSSTTGIDDMPDEAGIGYVDSIKDGVLSLRGVSGLRAGEIVWVKALGETGAESFIRGLALNLSEDSAQAILFGNERLVREGAPAYTTSQLFTLNCSLGLFGRVIDGIGELRGGASMEEFARETGNLVEQKATGIIDRVSVRIPLRTGIKAIDSLVPIGRGQRELIIGDRQTGKTSLAIDAILNHIVLNKASRFKSRLSDLCDLREVVWFVYNAIGQKQSTVNQIFRRLVAAGASWYTAIVSATASESASLQFLSPYTACTLGEFIRDVIGGHCVVVYDDLSKHAVAYRQMSLLLRRPPGREAFPGDVFYVHSRLLERAGSLTVTDEQVRGTLTAFPVIETQAGDVSAYIPTNVISITDGQIFLETEIFYRGIRPAVNVGLSVSRVGSAAQPALMKRVAGSLKMELAQFREVEGFAKLGASLDDTTQRLLNRGAALVEILKQGLHKPLTMFEEVSTLFLGLGYSGSWLSDVNRLSLPRQGGAQLFSKRRVRVSWFEALMSLSTEFGLAGVSQFVSQFLSWLKVSGITTLNLDTNAESSLAALIKEFPMTFFDDAVVAFLKERSLVDFVPVVEGTTGPVFLFNLVLGGKARPQKRLRLNRKTVLISRLSLLTLHNRVSLAKRRKVNFSKVIRRLVSEA